ncbi:unnamed protein product [Leptosia nina]|uniref:Uncharacterized protein n=1 Tax=Leptosia nina TaxID=320188 RepID=A0AAV1JSP3_9NEOP
MADKSPRATESTLLEEYLHRFNCYPFHIIRYSGIFRYDIRDDRFAKDTNVSFLRTTCICVLLVLCCCFFLYLTLTTDFFTTGELIMNDEKLKRFFIRKTFLIDSVVWKHGYDNLVTLDTERLRSAFSIMMRISRQLRKCYQFVPENKVRLLMITLWIPLSWIMKILTGLIVDIFLEQVESTQMICSYIMLQPSLPDEVRDIAESIFHLLEVNDVKFSVYGVYVFSSNSVLKSMTALVVFIILQLQYSFPPINESIDYNDKSIFVNRTNF